MPLRFSGPKGRTDLGFPAWAGSAQRTRRRYFAAVGVLLGIFLVLGAAVAYPRDRTTGLTALEIAHGAGRALRKARGYTFTVDLVGESADRLFPGARMAGEFRRDPLGVHLAGMTVSSDRSIELEYFLSGNHLFTRRWQDQTWISVPDASGHDLRFLRPDTLAGPLRGAVSSAEVVAQGHPDVEIKLGLDPGVMQPLLGAAHSGDVGYRLWVDRRSLRPVRFAVEYRAKRNPQDPHQVISFTYALAWDYRHVPVITVPERVRKWAVEVHNGSK